MNKISREALLQIAETSNLRLTEAELDLISSNIAHLVAYSQEIMDVTTVPGVDGNKPMNVFREDKAIPFKDTDKILNEAPDQDNNSFVVPNIL
jgi:aspartyl/glutamyl-tRNA(Asn/Gln) amidotransferase C subunit